MRAQACQLPVATCTQSDAVPTRVGLEWSTVVPIPSCPYPLWPQHHSAPEVVIPQVKLTDAEMDAHEWPPVTLTGVLRLVLVPSPSSPLSFSP